MSCIKMAGIFTKSITLLAISDNMFRILLYTTCFIILVLCEREYPSLTGQGNNVANNLFGSINQTFLRFSGNGYLDGKGLPNDLDMPRIFARASILDSGKYTEMRLHYLNFILHDMMSGLDDPNPSEPYEIPVTSTDVIFNPRREENITIPYSRAQYLNDTDGVRQYTNKVSSWIDGSLIYGHGQRSAVLRAGINGTLRLENGILPINTQNYLQRNLGQNEPSQSKLFLTADERGNVNAHILHLTLLFTKEHNRKCIELAQQNPTWSDETLFQEARLYVVALLNKIVYYDLIPVLTRYQQYTSYTPSTNPIVTDFFAAVTGKVVYTMMNSFTVRPAQDASGGNSFPIQIPQGPLNIKTSFYPKTTDAFPANDPKPLFRGILSQGTQSLDARVISELLGFHLGFPGAGGIDQIAQDIQTARDMGLPDYNTCRQAHGLSRFTSINQINTDPTIRSLLTELYGSNGINKIDAYVGALCELSNNAAGNDNLGPLLSASLDEQLFRTRNSDRFYFENMSNGLYNQTILDDIYNTTLSTLITRNLGISTNSIPRKPFWLEPVIPEAEFIDFKLEYSYEQKLNPIMKIHWNYNESHVSFLVQIKNTGWFGIGFNPIREGQMQGADITLVRYFATSNTFEVLDCYSTNNVGLPVEDRTINGTDSITSKNVTEINGLTIARFTKPRVSTDPRDAQLNSNNIQLIFAWGTENRFYGYHGKNTGHVTINLFTNIIFGVLADGWAYTVMSIAAVLIIVLILVGIMILVLCRTGPIKKSTPWILYVILLGGILLYISVILTSFLNYNHIGFCTTSMWSFGLGYVFIIGSFIAKNHRIYKFFSITKYAELNRFAKPLWSNLYILQFLVPIVVIEIIILIVWSSVFPPYAVNGFSYSNSVYTVCSYNPIFLSIALVYKFALIIWAVILSFLLRKVPSEFNEGFYMILSSYNLGFLFVVGAPLTAGIPDPLIKYGIFTGVVLFGISLTLGIFFVPKFYLIFLEWKNGAAPVVSNKNVQLEERNGNMNEIPDFPGSEPSKGESGHEIPDFPL